MYRKFFAVMMLFAATIMIGCSKDKKEEGGDSGDAAETSATAPLDVNQVKLDVTKMT